MARKIVSQKVVVSQDRVYSIGGFELRVTERGGKITEINAAGVAWETYIPPDYAPLLRDCLIEAALPAVPEE